MKKWVFCSQFIMLFLTIYLLIGILGACGKSSEPTKKSESNSLSPSEPIEKPASLPNSALATVAASKGYLDLRTAIIEVARQAIPAVVHIEVTERQEIPNPFFPFADDPFFKFFFPDVPRNYQREIKGIGTGILLDSQGHILTNNHVAGGATKIQVLLTDGKTYPGKLIGADPKTDLAVIKIEADKPLPYLTFGDSDKVEVGEWVVAIGHPRGLDQTVTQGIISAKHRTGITDPNSYQDFLQTDAAINPGNSGGPLLNLEGKVIGVNTAIMSQSGGYEGIGFAIPSNMALYVARELISKGKVQRGWLGVSAQDLSLELAKSFGLDSTRGALIAEVTKGSPADKAGIRRGDVVLSYRGKEISDASMLRNEVANTPIGEQVKILIWRDKKEKELIVTIGDLENVVKTETTSLKARLGGEFRPVTPEELEKYNLEASGGVVITWLDPNGPLAKVGLEVKDIILSIEGVPINDLESFASLIKRIPPNQKITLLVVDHRRGNTVYVQVLIK